MIKFYSTKPEDLNLFDLEDSVSDFREQMLINLQDPNKDIVSLFNASGRVIAFAGINHLRVGVCEAWIVRGKGINNHRFHFYKAIRKLIDFVTREMQIHRFEIAISKTFIGGRKWAESLGFKYEHTAEAYDLNYIDHDIFVRIKKWQQAQQ